MAFNLDQWLESLATAHSLLKIFVFLLLWAVAWSPIAIPLASLNGQPAKPLIREHKLPWLVSLYLVAPLVVWLAASVEGSSFADYGLDWQHWGLLRGISIGTGGIIIVFTLQGLLGWVQWQPENTQRLWLTALPLLGLGLGVGVVEELIFRGFFINELLLNYRYWSAAAISSLIFALLHLVWNRQDFPQLPGLWVMGMVLVGARGLDAGSLGLAWGLHAGWIWGLSSLEATELIAYTGKGATWITGLNGQPLAGAAGILCLLGTSALLWLLY